MGQKRDACYTRNKLQNNVFGHLRYALIGLFSKLCATPHR